MSVRMKYEPNFFGMLFGLVDWTQHYD